MPTPKYNQAFRDYLRDIGSRIRTLRDDLGLTTEAAAERADLSPGYWGVCERGVKQPSLQSLFGFAKALKVNVADLVGVGPASPALIGRSRRRRLEESLDAATSAQLKAMATCCRAILNLEPVGTSDSRRRAKE